VRRSQPNRGRASELERDASIVRGASTHQVCQPPE
jgi:hypothetical protein